MYSTLKDYRFNKDIDDTGQLSHEGLWHFPKWMKCRQGGPSGLILY